MSNTLIKGLYVNEKKIIIHEYFDEDYYINIKESINDTNLDIIKDYYEETYNYITINNSLDGLKNITDIIINKNNEIKKEYDKYINLSFFYDSTGPTSRKTNSKKYNNERIEINICAKNEELEKNKDKYEKFIESRIIRELKVINETIDANKNIHLFLGMKDTNLPYIKYEDYVEYKKNTERLREKKKKFQESYIISFVYDILKNIIRQNKNYELYDDNNILPDWYEIDLKKKNNVEKYKNFIYKDVKTKENSYDNFKFYIYALNMLHKKVNMFIKYEKKKSDNIKFFNFEIFATLDEIIKKEDRKYFGDNGIIKSDLNDFFEVNNIIFKIDKDQYDNIKQGNPISVVTNNQKNYILLLEKKKYRQGIVYFATLIDNENKKKNRSILIKKKRSMINENQNKKKIKIYTDTLVPNIEKKVDLFLYNPNFVFDYFHVKEFYKYKKSENIGILEFTLNLFTKKNLMNEFYIFCLNDDIYQKKILDTTSIDITKKQIAKQARMMIMKKNVFKLFVASQDTNKTNSNFKYNIYNVKIDSIKSQPPYEINVNISLINKFENSNNNNNNNNIIKNSFNLQSNCNEKKKSFFKYFYNMLNKTANSFETKIHEFKFKKKIGGKKTKKKKQKKKNYTIKYKKR